MSKYDFADYNTLNDDDKLLWWFDEYLCHDMVLVSCQVASIFLVQRHTIYDYEWAEDYIGKLWELATKTDFGNKGVGYMINKIRLIENNPQTITIPSTPLNQERQKIILAFLTLDTWRPQNTIYNRYLRHRIGESPPIYNIICFKKYYRFFYTQSESFDYTLPAHAPYSIVVTCDNNNIKKNIEDGIDPKSLYKNIDTGLYEEILDENNQIKKVNWFDKVKNDLGDFITLIEEDHFLETYTQESTDKDIFDPNNPNRILKGYRYNPESLRNQYVSKITRTEGGDWLNYIRFVEGGGWIHKWQFNEFPHDNNYPFYNGHLDSYLTSFLNYPETYFNLSLQSIAQEEKEKKYFDFNEVVEARLIYAKPKQLFDNIFKTPAKSNKKFSAWNYSNPIRIVTSPPSTQIDEEEVDKFIGTQTNTISLQFRKYDPNSWSVTYNEYRLNGILIWKPYTFSQGFVPETFAQQVTTITEREKGYDYKKKRSIYVKPELTDINNTNAQSIIVGLIADTNAFKITGNSSTNLEYILKVNSDGQPVDRDSNRVYNKEDYIYKGNKDFIEEYVMGLELMIQEIHACIGAGEFSYYEDDNGVIQPYFMNMARTLQRFARAYGVSFRADGTILPIRRREPKEYDDQNKVTIPDGWTRGQFADNTDESKDGQPSTGTDKDKEQERMGIAYQNRCNKYINFDDSDPENNTYKRGDVILCENFLQLLESYLEDMDKGLNWQEMGTGILRSADGTGYCTYEGIGTLLAEAVYMISQLSSNIYQTHNLSLQNTAMNYEILKGLGLPLKLGNIEVVVGENDALGVGDDVKAYIPTPVLADDAVSLHKRLMDVIFNLSIILSSNLSADINTSSAPPPPPPPVV